jgi:hypothetical protein
VLLHASKLPIGLSLSILCAQQSQLFYKLSSLILSSSGVSRAFSLLGSVINISAVQKKAFSFETRMRRQKYYIHTSLWKLDCHDKWVACSLRRLPQKNQ